MSDTPPKTRTNSRVVYQNRWITIREDQTIDQAGNTGTYGYMESRDSCMVVAVDDQERIFLVRAFRYPSQSFGWELPGGGGDGEDLIDASKRELEEETGIVARSWQKLGEAYVCNGLMTEKMAVCLARDLSLTGQRTDDSEVFSGSGFFGHADIRRMIQDGTINDCQTLAGLQYYQIWQASRNTDEGII